MYSYLSKITSHKKVAQTNLVLMKNTVTRSNTSRNYSAPNYMHALINIKMIIFAKACYKLSTWSQ